MNDEPPRRWRKRTWALVALTFVMMLALLLLWLGVFEDEAGAACRRAATDFLKNRAGSELTSLYPDALLGDDKNKNISASDTDFIIHFEDNNTSNYTSYYTMECHYDIHQKFANLSEPFLNYY